MSKLSTRIKYIIYFVAIVVSLLAITSGLLRGGPIEKSNISQDKSCDKDSAPAG